MYTQKGAVRCSGKPHVFDVLGSCYMPVNYLLGFDTGGARISKVGAFRPAAVVEDRIRAASTYIR